MQGSEWPLDMPMLEPIMVSCTKSRQEAAEVRCPYSAPETSSTSSSLSPPKGSMPFSFSLARISGWS
eukprot:9554412-Alexandrium_andersonii.AAC.1